MYFFNNDLIKFEKLIIVDYKNKVMKKSFDIYYHDEMIPYYNIVEMYGGGKRLIRNSEDKFSELLKNYFKRI